MTQWELGRAVFRGGQSETGSIEPRPERTCQRDGESSRADKLFPIHLVVPSHVGCVSQYCSIATSASTVRCRVFGLFRLDMHVIPTIVVG